MCGRIVEYLSDEQITDYLHVVGPDRLGVGPNYNLKPTQTLRAVRLDEDGKRRLAALRWGFVPSWSKEMPKAALINAKAEGIADKPTWRSAFKHRRCLVPVNGFYEWLKPAKGPKQPYYIFLPKGAIMVFAGIWEAWREGKPDGIESAAVATVAPSKEFSRFHDRQVVVLHTKKEQNAWLDPDTPPEEALALLKPLPAGLLQFRSVSNAVNTSGYHGPDCIIEGKIDAPTKPLKIKRPAREPKAAEADSQQNLL